MVYQALMIVSRNVWPIWLAFGMVVTLGVISLKRFNKSYLMSHPRPAEGYDEAVQRIDILRRQEPLDMKQVCRLQFMTHAKRVERAIVLVHGYTNCPQQFREFGCCFYELGYNVLIAPLPYHGLTDRLTKAHARLGAQQLVQYTDDVVDIAQGLGAKVDIAGISGGGILAAYAGQFRKDVNVATIMAPAFGFKNIPSQLTGGFVNLLSFLPNLFIWWDREQKQVAGIEHAYPRFSTHALVQTLRVGMAVRSAAKRQAPAARRLLVITNGNEPGVNGDLIEATLCDWRWFGANLTHYEFPADLKLEHDFIEPENPKAQTTLVYPRLVELMTAAE